MSLQRKRGVATKEVSTNVREDEIISAFLESCESSQNYPTKPTEASTNVNENELSSELAESLTLTEDTVLFRGAQVAKESTPLQSKEVDPTRLRAQKCQEFTIKRPEDTYTRRFDKVGVMGLLYISNNIAVIDYDNKVLKLFDQSGKFLSSTELMDRAWGLTRVSDNMFATCGISHSIHLWSILEQKMVKSDVLYHVDNFVHEICYNGKYYVLKRNHNNAIIILDKHGVKIRKFTMKEACGKRFDFGGSIHMDRDTNNIYAPCWDDDGVLCFTIEGNGLWFIPMSRPSCIAEIQGTLCVADKYQTCIHLITKEGNYIKKLLDRKDLTWEPRYICYGDNGKLYISYGYDDPDMVGEESNLITVFSVNLH